VFGLACSTSWLLILHRYTFALIKNDLMREQHLSASEIGLIDSGFAMTYTLFQFPLGVAADALGVRLVLTTLIVVWSIGLALHAWAPNKNALWLARAVLGLGQSAVLAAINRIARQWFPANIRTTLQGLAGIFAGRVGGLSANLIFATLLVGTLGLEWRTAIWLFASLGFVQAAAFVVLFRNSPREHPGVNAAEAALIAGDTADASRPESAPQRMTIGQLLRGMTPAALLNFAALNVQTILSTFADNIFSNWIPLFLARVHKLDFAEMGLYSALPLLGGAIGGALGGVLNDACIARTGNRRWSRRGVGLAGKGLAAVLIFASLAWYHNPYAFCFALFFVKFFSDWSLTTSWGAVTDIGGRATASVFAFNNAVAGIGSIAAPAALGYVAQHAGWPAVFFVTGAAYTLCALSWLAIDCTLPLVRSEPAPTSP
jgi:sugar phosphate permease